MSNPTHERLRVSSNGESGESRLSAPQSNRSSTYWEARVNTDTVGPCEQRQIFPQRHAAMPRGLELVAMQSVVQHVHRASILICGPAHATTSS